MIRIILADGNDVSLFGSKQEAESYCEAIDVEREVYIGYDYMGRLLKFSTFGPVDNVHKRRVKITLAEKTPLHQEALKSILLNHISAGVRCASYMSLSSLLQLCENTGKS